MTSATANPTETNFDLSSFYGVGEDCKSAKTIDEALDICKLNFTVSQHDLMVVGRDYHHDSDGNPVLDRNKRHVYNKTEVERDENDPTILHLSQDSTYHGLRFPVLSPIIRDDTMEVVSVMGSGYTIVQNRECVQTLADILLEAENEGSPLQLFRGGVINGCSFLYLSAKLPYDMEIPDGEGGFHKLHQYLIIQWSHTGEGKVNLAFAAYSPRDKVFLYNGSDGLDVSIRHTKNATSNLDQAKKYMKKMYQAFSNFQRQLTMLAEKPMDQKLFEKFLEEEVFPTPENLDPETKSGKRTMTQIVSKRGGLADRFMETNAKTAFDGYMAVCKYHDADTTMKQKKEGVEKSKLKSEGELRLFSSFKGSGVKAKRDAFKALTTIN